MRVVGRRGGAAVLRRIGHLNMLIGVSRVRIVILSRIARVPVACLILVLHVRIVGYAIVAIRAIESKLVRMRVLWKSIGVLKRDSLSFPSSQFSGDSGKKAWFLLGIRIRFRFRLGFLFVLLGTLRNLIVRVTLGVLMVAGESP